MDSIHAPTVASRPTSGHAAANDADRNRLSLMELITEKDRIVAELKALGEVLDSVWVPLSERLPLPTLTSSGCRLA